MQPSGLAAFAKRTEAKSRIYTYEQKDGAVFEDALAGVESGRAGNFAIVVGVDRVGQAEELLARGATIVVRDLAELLDDEAAAS